MTDPKTPAGRKAEARNGLIDSRRSDILAFSVAIDAYARACIDEAVAPALEYIELLKESGLANGGIENIRKLLTERAGT